MRVAVIGWHGQETNPELAAAWRALGLDAIELSPDEAACRLCSGDIALTRLDVLPTLDGVERGLPVVRALARRGVRVLNTGDALLAAHDKLETAARLARAGIPHPRTFHVTSARVPAGARFPVVVKPRFGSWGRAVYRCSTDVELHECLMDVGDTAWFLKHGAVVQELVPPLGHDLRLIVAGGRVVGAARRVAAPGEWRTNVSLGGSVERACASPGVRALAVAAAGTLGIDLVGVDLLPLHGGDYVVVELNGAVDFDNRYALPAADVYEDAAVALGLTLGAARPRAQHRAELTVT